MYFTLYCIIKKNKPKVYPSIILPGLVKLKADVSNYFDLNLLFLEKFTLKFIISIGT